MQCVSSQSCLFSICCLSTNIQTTVHTQAKYFEKSDVKYTCHSSLSPKIENNLSKLFNELEHDSCKRPFKNKRNETVHSVAYYGACKHVNALAVGLSWLDPLGECFQVKLVEFILITTCRRLTAFWQQISWEKQAGWSCWGVCVSVSLPPPVCYTTLLLFKLCIIHAQCISCNLCVCVCVWTCVGPAKWTFGWTAVWHGWRWFSCSALWAWRHPHKCRWNGGPPRRHGWCSPRLLYREPPLSSPQTP